MRPKDVFPAWGRILRGYRPFLALEVTKLCPLRCPGCYAYQANHISENRGLQDVQDSRGQELIDGVLRLVRHYRPMHVSLVGGEPLLRHRELGILIPKLDRLGIEVQLVTSAVMPIPPEYRSFRNLHIVVSVDGLREEHDRRRSPATYDRILENISGHAVIVHCTVTKQFAELSGAVCEFAAFWSAREEVRKIWFSLYTPQEGEDSMERLTDDTRRKVLAQLRLATATHPKVQLPAALLSAYEHPPRSSEACTFAQVTACVSADLVTLVTPCQLGGTPVCSECGCIASAGLAAVGAFRIAGIVSLTSLLRLSAAFGRRVGSRRTADQ